MQKTADISGDGMLLLSVQLSFKASLTSVHVTCPSSSPTTPPIPHPASTDLRGEERGDRRLPAAEQREEARPGPCEVSARNMTAAHSPSALDFNMVMEESSGVFSQHLTDHQPHTSTPSKQKKKNKKKSRSELAAWADLLLFFTAERL